MQSSTSYFFVANALVIAGSIMLLSVLLGIQRLYIKLASRKTRANKYFLMLPALLLILGYLGYLPIFWKTQKNWHDLIMPGVLFVSAFSLWFSHKVSLQSMVDWVLEQENITDPLMGIYNRRYLERRLAEEVARAQRYGAPLSVFLLDIDQLKDINKSHGRRTGDQVLVHLGKLLLEYVRESDEVARYDQDAVLVMTPNTAIHDTHLLADRIRQRVEVHPLLLNARTDKEERIAIRISVGVATMQGSFDSLEKLLQRAEVALQQARQDGGNRVVVSETGFTETKTLN